jgi:hypothetical protein
MAEAAAVELAAIFPIAELLAMAVVAMVGQYVTLVLMVLQILEVAVVVQGLELLLMEERVALELLLFAIR